MLGSLLMACLHLMALRLCLQIMYDNAISPWKSINYRLVLQVTLLYSTDSNCLVQLATALIHKPLVSLDIIIETWVGLVL